jgi:hemoglobin-like flavoprotein
MLVATLGIAVSSLDNLEQILPVIRALGRRHKGYGVQPHHYTVVGQALVQTLQVMLGPAFTNEAKAAWVKAYGVLSETMKEAAR